MRRTLANLRDAFLVGLLGVCCSGPALAQFVPPPNSIGSTLEACRNGGNVAITPSGTLPNADGRFVCQDPAPLGGNDNPYTTGNLSKDWSELDLVPHRLILTNSGAATTYNVQVAADYENNAILGYDAITTPVIIPSGQLNGFSASGCAVTSTAFATVPNVTGGAGQSIYRTLTITHPAGTQQNKSTCVVDFAMRLAVGAHRFPGSSLQSYKFESADFSTGKATISLPVNEIAPQELSKTMSASRNAERTWNVTKVAAPGSVDFGNVCKATSLEKPVQITVTWQKLAASPSGDVTVVTNINVKNPAARSITVNVTDKVYTGQDSSGSLLATQTHSASVAAFYNGLFKTFTYTVPAVQAGSIGDWLNDVVMATYTDDITGVPVPGTTSATAKAQIQLGTTLNETANIADLETITGLGLKFKVAAPSVGSFSGYTAGDAATSVDWGVTGLTDSGSVTFNKTVVLDAKRITSGELTDVATLVSTDSQFTTQGALAAPVSISSSATVSLKIVKTLPIALNAGEKVVVNFTVTPTLGGAGMPVSVTFNGPSSIGASASATVENLDPASYTVTEGSAVFYANALSAGSPLNLQPDQGTQTKDLSPKAGGLMDASNCSGELTFVNAIPSGDLPTAQVKKITLPAQTSTDGGWAWKFTLACSASTPSCQDFVAEEVTAYAGQGFVVFTSPLSLEGTYTVTEQKKTPLWALTSVIQPDGSTSATEVCSFNVVFPDDLGASKVFSCTFTNTKQGNVQVIKTLNGQTPSTELFTFQLRKGATNNADGQALETLTTNSGGNGATLNFATLLVPGDTYQMCEATGAGWMTSFNNNQDPYFVPGAFVPPGNTIPNVGVDNSWLCVNFTVQPGQTKVFNVDNKPPPGGRALTIGYWKNHASCVGPSNKTNPQDLDVKLYARLPNGILMSSIIASQAKLGSYGLYGQNPTTTNDCPNAVRLLDKRNFKGTKMASDPLFNMVAQLVAVELNLAAGSYTCPAVTTAVTAAEGLLAKYKFDGFGYKNAQNKQQLSAADATLANSLATTLDNYNNNRPGVCP